MSETMGKMLFNIGNAMDEVVDFSYAIELAATGLSDAMSRSAMLELASILTQRLESINDNVDMARSLLCRDDGVDGAGSAEESA